MGFLKSSSVWTSAFLIQCCIMEKIFRGFCYIRCQLFHKFFFVFKLETIVFSTFNLKSLKISSSDWFPTSRSCTMSRKYLQRMIEFLDLLNWVKEHCSQVSTCYILGNSQVRPSHLSQENCVSSEQSFSLASWVNKLKTWTFHGVARGVVNFEFDAPKANSLSIFALLNFEWVDSSSSWWTHDDGYFELSMTREEISMIVGQEDILQLWWSLWDKFLIGLHIEDWVDEDTFLLWFKIVGEYG